MEKERGLSGASLKWIAIVIMAIDHAGAALMEPILQAPSNGSVEFFGIHMSIMEFYNLYVVIRAIGRTAFPIFMYLILEGYCHTRSKGKYVRNLLFVGLLSDIPFDLALFQKLFDFRHQNVMFTLALGIMMLWLIELIVNQVHEKHPENVWMCKIIEILTVVLFMAIAEYVLCTDYGYMGVLCIYVIYKVRPHRVLGVFLSVILLTLMNGLEVYALPAVLLVKFYNGTRGKQNKYFFYFFYPVHLFLLFLIAYIYFY